MKDQEKEREKYQKDEDDEPLSEEETKEIYNRWAKKMGKPTI